MDEHHAALFALHEGLPRQGPGSDACTREALRRLPALPSSAAVADLGCGSGASTRVLAAMLGRPVLAVDIHLPFLRQLAKDAPTRVTGCRADLGAPPLRPGSVDLLWCEGALYLVGFAEGLRRWRSLLAPRGLLAVTECSWLVAQPPAEAAAFWRDAYPGIATVAQNVERARAQGYTVLDTLVLPPFAWWRNYYRPLQARIEALRSGADTAMQAVIAESEAEIDLYRRHGDSYGYVFYLLRRRE